MNLPQFCIRRPAFTIVISLVLIILGLIGYLRAPVRWIPNVYPPQVTISTTYAGANAKTVEKDVTKIIEGGLSNLTGVESLTSSSSQGESSIGIQFKLGRDMDAAVADVRGSVDRIRSELPKDASNPVILKADPNSEAVLYISLFDQARSERELSDYASKFLVPSLETIDGVGTVWVYGQHQTAIRIALDPAKMAAANITVDEITQLLRAMNASVPSGQIRSSDRYYSVVVDTALKNPEEFNQLILRDENNQVLRLQDIGHAAYEVEDPDSIFRINGKAGVALGVVPQSTANPLDIAAKIRDYVNDLQRTLPSGMKADIIYNQADYIRASLHSVYESFFEAVLFVWLVIYAFLGRWRATWIPIITIPVCIIASFALIYLLNFTVNTITLMALVLAIGLVVDDAIVMLENISRYIEQGKTPLQAAFQGSREMIFPVIAMTITLAAVYAPIAFTDGLLGILFREFTFTLAGAVIISGLVALTLTPMMCSRLLKPQQEETRYQRWLETTLHRAQTRYQSLLMQCLHYRRWVLGLMLVLAVSSYGLYRWLPAELAPEEDRDSIFVSINAPKTASATYTDHYIKQMEQLISQIPDVKTYLSMGGFASAANAFQIVMLKPKSERQHSLAEISQMLSGAADKLAGVRVFAFIPPSPLTQISSNDSGHNLGLVLMTGGDYRRLQDISQELTKAIKANPLFTYADNALKWDNEELQVNIDRAKAADLNVPITTITDTLSTMIAGRMIGKVDDANVWVRLNQTALADSNVFQKMYVRNTNNEMQALNNLVSVQEMAAPQTLNHYERLRADTISLSLAPNAHMADAVSALQAIATKVVPDDVKFAFTGEAKSFVDSSGATLFTFGLAILFIYLVLVAQFESFIDPFIILLTVPFAFSGALLTLKLFGGTLNIFSNIGMVTLVGLIAKHGILITDFANREQAKGKPLLEAVIAAAGLRLRPILMTSAAMILGALPLAFAMGPGSESRQQIGLVITGGLFVGTFFSLIVVPITYTLLAPLKKRFTNPIDEEVTDAVNL